MIINLFMYYLLPVIKLKYCPNVSYLENLTKCPLLKQPVKLYCGVGFSHKEKTLEGNRPQDVAFIVHNDPVHRLSSLQRGFSLVV